ncbi:hypothetical protein BDR03DRAFT_973102 [Suillus americanus]|nr:hypothetical protein BDR03DRAFT_973102 [Suillus americanus]
MSRSLLLIASYAMPHIYNEFSGDLWNSTVVLRLFLPSRQKPTVEELLDEDTRCDTPMHKLWPISPSLNQCHLSCRNFSCQLLLSSFSYPARSLLLCWSRASGLSLEQGGRQAAMMIDASYEHSET